MRADSPTVRRVLRGELCTGCGLCAGVSGGAIQMRASPPGYNRPEVVGPVSAESEKVIADACPGSVVAPWGGAPEIDPYWGPYRQVLTGAALDDEVRYQGSSGGVISALLIHALESGVVDRVVQISADPDRPTQNMVRVSRTPSEVLACAGSRYTASSPLADLNAHLAEGGSLAFVGKPCDVSALRQAARHDPRIRQHVPVALSFFCGGIPSHDGVGRILGAMGLSGAEISTFRYRGQGWPGLCVAEAADGRRGEMSYHESWGHHLSKEVQFRCKICPDAVGGVADIACADAWYGDEAGYPSFEEEEGRSLILGRTEAGERLLESAIAGGVLSVAPLPVGEIGKMQPAQARRKRLVQARVAALPLVGQPVPRMRDLKVGEAAKRAPRAEALRNLVGTLRRTLQGRRSRL
ncbi:MAG: Coenzyme F420 hydrogenase/dehydrogenase, beta subunit C-terminal domain [Pseudomonadota bacterium]